MQDSVDIHVLGPVEVTGPQGSVSLHGAGQRTLIARLGLPPGTTVSGEALIHALWAEAAPPTAAKTLNSYESRSPCLTRRRRRREVSPRSAPP
jgi:DNA-binding SARP family transcriptional activator